MSPLLIWGAALLMAALAIVPGIAFGKWIYQRLQTHSQGWYLYVSFLSGLLMAIAIMEFIKGLLIYIMEHR